MEKRGTSATRGTTLGEVDVGQVDVGQVDILADGRATDYVDGAGGPPPPPPVTSATAETDSALATAVVSPSVGTEAAPARPQVVGAPSRSRVTSLEFAWVAFLLIASLIGEAIAGVFRFVVFLFRRNGVRAACHRLIRGEAIQGDSRPAAPIHGESARRAGSIVLLLALAVIPAASGCRTIKRDIDETIHSTHVMFFDTEGDLESLGDSLAVFFEVEPVDELLWSTDQMLGVTEVGDDARSLGWTLSVLGDWRSDVGGVWETLQFLAE